MKLENLLRQLGEQIESAEEETYDLFSQDLPSQQGLGFINSKAPTLDLTIADRDLTIHQSPGILSSNRAGGTTGAVVWKVSPIFAEWLTTAGNPLFSHGVLSPRSAVVELGCGISPVVGLLLAPRISQYVLTDQPYVARLVEQNIAENDGHQVVLQHKATANKRSANKGRTGGASSKGSGSGSKGGGATGTNNSGQIRFTPLDWETDDVSSALTRDLSGSSFDAVLACDCIYNEALVEAFVSACVDICRLREAELAAYASSSKDDAKSEESGSSDLLEPSICLIAQHLRTSDVFETWMDCFLRSFHVWRIPDTLVLPGLRSGSGFVVHLGVLRGGAVVGYRAPS
ncbi:ribosomal lysine N-methyltransferase 5 [Diplogelasinospora grovesii]|uniref:Ribosomal lysine N-methyltransferase 5 n=1 Tax=Diplogelasinospora grovesii TaxID=303347 RepID=A0AAN6NG48_9PEZI|nr:ribosomal lysine N-methyltransferase 5 [Diplogelasinospora grovesii]